MDALGIETRARSRSKTPAILLGENGDYEGGVKKGSKKIPTVSLIEEEEVVEVAASQSQRPKRQRKSAKVASDTSGEMESPKNSQQKTTVEIKTSQREVTNGSNKEKSDLSPPPAIITTTTSTITTNNVMLEAPENQSIFNNIFNVIKTSTPILSTSKRSKRISQEVKSNTSTSPTIDIKQHPAYKEYKEAGEYWNKFPKTDYTYSELSPHRRQLGNGVVNMPNMSRRSLEKYSQRVEHMIQNNPQEESFLRRKFLSNSFQKRSAELQYDSADEVDVSDLHRSLATRQQKQSNFFYSFYLLIVTAFSSAYSSAKQGVKKVLYYRTNQTPSRYTYTPIKHYGQSGSQRIFNAVQKFVLLCASKVYLLISTVLCLDTWLLYNRSANVVENKKRKRFLLALLILLPLLLFGGTYIYLDPPQNISFPKITLPAMPKISLPKITLPSLSLPELSWPAWLTISFSLPSLSLPSWFKLPSISFNWPDISVPSFSWPAWLALPTISWPEWLTFSVPTFSFAWLTLPSLSWPEWLSFSAQSFSFNLPEFSLPSWFKLPSFSFNWPEISLPTFSLSWPSWLTFSLPSLSWPEWLKLPEVSLPSVNFDFLSPIASYTADTFTSLKLTSIELFDKVRDATFGFLNEAQIVWSENFNAK